VRVVSLAAAVLLSQDIGAREIRAARHTDITRCRRHVGIHGKQRFWTTWKVVPHFGQAKNVAGADWQLTIPDVGQ
jgi:hypothetical protein